MPDPEIVGGPDAASPPVPDSGKTPGGEPDKKPDKKPDAKVEAKPDGKPARDYEAELSEKNRQIEELNQSALHWFNKAKGVTTPKDDGDDEPEKPAKSAKAEPDEDEDPDKFVNKLATVGSKAIDEYMAKRGYMPAKQIEELVEARVSAVTRTEQLYAEYPDLRNEQSELFKETQKDFGEMVAMDKSLSKSPAAIKIAVKTAAARLKAASDIAEAKKPKETEAERRTRIAAQAGDLGRRGGGEFTDEAPTALDDETKDMMRKFNQAGGGPDISEEALLKRMARGPRMVYRPGRDAQGRYQ